MGDIVVSGTVPAVPAGNPDASLMPMSSGSGSMVGGPPPEAAIAIDFQSGAYYNRSLPALSKIIKSAKSEAEKQKNSLIWFRNCIFLNKCEIEHPNDGIYVAQKFYSKERTDLPLNGGSKQLGNSPYAIASAFGNFLWGNGQSMSVDINTLALQFLTADKIPGFNSRMNAIGAPGTYNMTFAFPYDTGRSNYVMEYILGNITLQMDGVFTRNATGSWAFDGVIRAQVPDKYDFDASTHRTKTNEDLTTIGRWMGERFKGVPYKIEINGQTHVKF
ncbi:lipid II-degrading bacteriocin [Pantoea sp. Al-1710]|uniref:Lipid II-degrading bacteriocin n=1 Tax=Candidatus Pantoea communis TaxID=2608354 RepID=A0ABX0RIJ8_9GAMM|nr:lipid II-degrading bacteriocin [Pantoea communis]NIG17451.1 lipid II-degrading bacteriocin [Pantoea communis]